ncbi:Uncharacterised protein [Mycobacteroides abscessus subsp. abscessus]|nr:Uncharacterised protein [Mycobacteroides abscessus subsp. abscessus]
MTPGPAIGGRGGSDRSRTGSCDVSRMVRSRLHDPAHGGWEVGAGQSEKGSSQHSTRSATDSMMRVGR